MARETPAGRPAELVLMATVARRYFIDGASKIDIADETGLSRFKVARLLDKARETGLVRIEIDFPGSIDVELSGALQARFGFHHALVLDVPEDHPESLREHLGSAAADLLDELVSSDDVLGLAWARSLSAMGGALKHLAPCTVVQLTGALPRLDAGDSSIELVREVARVSGGPAYFFYAPMIVSTAQIAQALRQQPEVARAMGRIPSVSVAVVGIGSWDPPFSTVYDALDPTERASLYRSGVRAEVSGILIDADGVPVATSVAERTIGVTAAQLRGIPEVIAIAYGRSKAAAVVAAIRGGLVNALVTHRSLAQAVLELAGPGTSEPAAPPRGAR